MCEYMSLYRWLFLPTTMVLAYRYACPSNRYLYLEMLFGPSTRASDIMEVNSYMYVPVYTVYQVQVDRLTARLPVLVVGLWHVGQGRMVGERKTTAICTWYLRLVHRYLVHGYLLLVAGWPLCQLAVLLYRSLFASLVCPIHLIS